jgi:mannose-6-phosphate isomerase
METTERPWGYYEVLIDHSYYKVKKIVVKPGQKLSEQYHHKRDETWTVVLGEGIFWLDGKAQEIRTGVTVKIPRLATHRVQNTSTEHMLVFIEVQTGDYFGEDDIVRTKDDYGRA